MDSAPLYAVAETNTVRTRRPSSHRGVRDEGFQRREGTGPAPILPVSTAVRSPWGSRRDSSVEAIEWKSHSTGYS